MNLLTHKKLLTKIFLAVGLLFFVLFFIWYFLSHSLFYSLIFSLAIIFILQIVSLTTIYLISYSKLGVSEKDLYFLKRAFTEAEKSLMTNDFPVGALVVCDGEVIGCGHNSCHDNSYHNHAEVIAINRALNYLQVESFEDQNKKIVLYTTYEPCSMCEGMIVLKKIPRVVVGKRKFFRRLVKENYLGYVFYRLQSRGGINENIHDVLENKWQENNNQEIKK